MKNLTAEDLMTVETHTITPDALVHEAMEKMNKLGIRHLPVLGENNELLGMITNTDLMAIQFNEGQSIPKGVQEGLENEVQVKEIMSHQTLTVEPDESALDAAGKMIENKVGALPVVKRGELVGILSETDYLMAWMAENSS